MAAYPTTPPFRTVSIKPITRAAHRVAESGKVRGYSLSASPAYRITLRHPMCTSSDRATLETFIGTNRYVDNTVTPSDGNAYDVWFESDDYTYRERGPTYADMEITLLAERQ